MYIMYIATPITLYINRLTFGQVDVSSLPHCRCPKLHRPSFLLQLAPPSCVLHVSMEVPVLHLYFAPQPRLNVRHPDGVVTRRAIELEGNATASPLS